MKTTAVRKGDKWVINGSKCFITNGEYANWYTVYAKTDKEAGHRGISCFIVPRDAGVIVDKHEDKMGQRASNTATITFPEVEIPLDHLVGEENKGFKIAMMTLDRTRPAWRRWPPAWPAPRWSSRSTTPRSGSSSACRSPCTRRSSSSSPTWRPRSIWPGWPPGTRRCCSTRASATRSSPRTPSASPRDIAMEVTTDAVQVYGGYGFIKEYPVEKLMRDAKILQLYEGTAQIQRLVIARETLLPRRVEEARDRGRLTFSDGRPRAPGSRPLPEALQRLSRGAPAAELACRSSPRLPWCGR